MRSEKKPGFWEKPGFLVSERALLTPHSSLLTRFSRRGRRRCLAAVSTTALRPHSGEVTTYRREWRIRPRWTWPDVRPGRAGLPKQVLETFADTFQLVLHGIAFRGPQVDLLDQVLFFLDEVLALFQQRLVRVALLLEPRLFLLNGGQPFAQAIAGRGHGFVIFFQLDVLVFQRPDAPALVLFPPWVQPHKPNAATTITVSALLARFISYAPCEAVYGTFGAGPVVRVF